MQHDDRLSDLYAKLAARTKPDPERMGRRIPLNANYAPNVRALQAEIEKLEERLTAMALLNPEGN